MTEGKFPCLASEEVVIFQRLDVADLVVLLHILEDGQRVPDAGGQVALRYGWTGHRRIHSRSRAAPGLHVVGPRDVLVVEEPRDVGQAFGDSSAVPVSMAWSTYFCIWAGV